MAFSLQDVRDLVKANFGSHGSPDRAGGIEDPDMDRLIGDAAKFYSTVNPDRKNHDQSGDGTKFDFPLPSDWDESFSVILRTESPTGNRSPSFLNPNEVVLYNDTNAEVIRLLTTTPATGTTVRFVYTVPRIVDEESSNTTVPDSHKEAIGHLTTHYVALRLAAEMAKAVRSAIQDDPLGLRAAVGEYMQVARRHWELFADEVGIPPDGSKIASANGEVVIPNRMSWGHAPFTHDDASSRIFRRGT